MRWPRLVRAWAQGVPVAVSIDADGIDEDGAPIVGAEWSGSCNWQDVSGRTYTRDTVEVEVGATLYIDGDPFPSVPFITGGTVAVAGEEREILKGSKARNPDGTVNHTRIDLR